MTPFQFPAAERSAFRPSTELGAALSPSKGRPATRRAATLFGLVMVLLSPAEARASFLSPELEDKLATFLALFIIFVVPVVLIALFWMVHVLPEKIAHKRHHPQFEAIRTLCLLSLVFGGLLWPIAWIWAYTKPVMHKIAYGTDKASHDEEAAGDAWDEGKSLHQGGLGLKDSLKDRLARLEQRGIPASDLKALRADLEALEAQYAQEAR